MENSGFYFSQFYCNFAISRNTFTLKHKYETKNGFIAPHIGYIKKGSSLFFFPGMVLNAEEGDIIFIPQCTPYRSEWSGAPEIEMFALEIECDYFNEYNIPAQTLHLPNLCSTFENLYFKTTSADTIGAFSELLSILDTAFKELNITHKDKAKITAPALNFIEQNYNTDFSIETLARLCNLSQSCFFVVFKKENKYTPVDYKNFIRTKHAIKYIKRGGLSIEEICEKLNFSSPAYFRRILKKFTGRTPSQIKKEHEI